MFDLLVFDCCIDYLLVCFDCLLCLVVCVYLIVTWWFAGLVLLIWCCLNLMCESRLAMVCWLIDCASGALLDCCLDVVCSVTLVSLFSYNSVARWLFVCCVTILLQFYTELCVFVSYVFVWLLWWIIYVVFALLFDLLWFAFLVCLFGYLLWLFLFVCGYGVCLYGCCTLWFSLFVC